MKAAEILELVDTPKQDIFLVDSGRKFKAADQFGQRAIFVEKMYKLRIFHRILAPLRESKKIESALRRKPARS